MSITIELPLDVEKSLSAAAREEGVPLPIYVSRLLTESVPSGPQVSPAQRARIWRDSVLGSAGEISLLDEAMSRERIYDSRG